VIKIRATYFHIKLNNIFTCLMTVGGVCIGNWIYWNFISLSTVNYSGVANSHTLQYTTTLTEPSRLSPGNGSQHRTFLSLRVQRPYRSVSVSQKLFMMVNPGNSLLVASGHRYLALISTLSADCPDTDITEKTSSHNSSIVRLPLSPRQPAVT
jgi:hypothetical protein